MRGGPGVRPPVIARPPAFEYGTMNGVQFLRLVADARAFRQSCGIIEDEIRRLNARPGVLAPIGGSTGWPSHNVWESLKTVSHFNLAVSLELRLKCFLHLHGIKPVSGRAGHMLAKLHDQLDEQRDSRDTRERLEDLFRNAREAEAFSLVAFLSSDSPDAPEGPLDRKLDTLRDLLAYLDEDMELWRKRYSWEVASEEQWRHYVDNLNAFLRFLDATEAFATELARQGDWSSSSASTLPDWRRAGGGGGGGESQTTRPARTNLLTTAVPSRTSSTSKRANESTARLRRHSRHLRPGRRATAQGIPPEHVLHVAQRRGQPGRLPGGRGGLPGQVSDDRGPAPGGARARLAGDAPPRGQHLLHVQAGDLRRSDHAACRRG